MNKIISAFTGKLGAKIVLEDTLILKEKGKLFLLNMELKKLIQEIGIKPIYAGVYLGSQKQKRFVPSFPLLFMIADKAEKKVFLNDKAAWLFVCGRDIFSEGILHVEGPVEKGDFVLLFNKHGECLGYGLVKQNPHKARKGLVIKNLLDIGDFLRREKKDETRPS